MKKQFLFSLMFGLVIFPSLTLANDDTSEGDSLVPALYMEYTEGEKAIPMLISESGSLVPTLHMEGEKNIPMLISEKEEATPELINEKIPTLYLAGKSISYTNPETRMSYQINNAYDAFMVMQKNGLGINQKDYDRFAKNAPSRLDGRILLNVEDHGKAYIVDYKNNKLVYLNKPENAFKVFRGYSLQAIAVKDWKWVKTLMNDDKIISPKKNEDFSLIFNEDGSFNGTTDCNNFFGQYKEIDSKLSFGPIASTKMFCEGSQELEFTSSLDEIESFMFNESGNLVLLLKFDSGSMIFE